MNALISDETMNNTIYDLKSLGIAKVTLFGSTAYMQQNKQDGKLEIISEVFKGKDFISDNVRACLQGAPSMQFFSIPTHLMLNEDEHRIVLRYLGLDSITDKEEFKDLIEQFCLIAEEWRYFLDDHDKKDFVHVRAR